MKHHTLVEMPYSYPECGKCYFWKSGLVQTSRKGIYSREKDSEDLTIPHHNQVGGNLPERCPRPLYSRNSTQEDLPIPHHHQGEDVIDIKVEGEAEEEETYVRDDEQSMEEDGITGTYIEEDTPTEISTVHGQDMRRRSEDCVTLSADCKVEDEDMRRRSEDCLTLSADCKVEDEDMRRRSEDCVTLSAECKVEDEDMRRRSEDCVTLSAEF
ncbi:uncharacterized protein ACMZJ9_014132 [Mantella aurantiaca]